MIVIDVETLSRGMPSNKVNISSRLSIATPTFPTSPNASGSSESSPICVGRSNATLNPVVPCDSRYLYRAFDSSAVANPAYCRIVQNLQRYILRRTPRVYGNEPGSPRSSAKSTCFVFDGLKSFGSSIPDEVSNRSRRSPVILAIDYHSCRQCLTARK